jgi:hypothetical protein
LHFDSFGEENYNRPQNRNKAVEILLYDRLQFVIGCAADQTTGTNKLYLSGQRYLQRSCSRATRRGGLR